MSEVAEKNIVETSAAIDDAAAWVRANRDQVPASVVTVILFAVKLKDDLAKTKNNLKKILFFWRQELGIIPRSERGEKLASIPKTDQQKFDELKAKRAKLNKQIRRYQERLGKKPQKKVKRSKPLVSGASQTNEVPLVEAELAKSGEELFVGNLCDLVQNQQRENINRMNHFDRTTGLHSSHDDRKRYEYGVTVRTLNIQVETVTDFKTGKSVTASTEHIGPPGSQATWLAIANTITSVIGYAIPINRLAKMLKDSNPYFTSTRLCSFLDYAAELFLPIYLHLGEALADADWFMGDDTKTKVLEISRTLKNGEELSDADKESRIGKVASLFGRVFGKKNGEGHKRGLNVSVVIGKTVVKDCRSLVYFFRTHLGSLGDLLSNILEMRDPKKKELTLVSDQASTNILSKEIHKKFKITYAACSAHARRPFFRYKNLDETLCYWMLSAFLILEQIEDRLDELGRTRELVLKHRQRYSKKIWEAKLRRAKSVVAGETKTYDNFYWPKSSDLYKACNYIINHYEELTRYLEDPRLPSTNNLSERVLRWDKIMLDSSKFRATENGRLNVDILRTITHSCSAAEVELKDYLFFVFKNRQKISENPSLYTPYSYALSLEQIKTANKA